MSSPVFGKRNASLASVTLVPTSASPVAAVAADQAAFFAAARAELADGRDERRLVVPRSFKAAFLAGLVVGCGLAGFDVTGHAAETASESPFATIAAALGTPMAALPAGTSINLAPVTMLLGLTSGARIAALTLIVVHGLMSWLDVSSRTAYALGGAAISTVLAAALFIGLGHPPSHGWAVEIAAGAAAGFLYRVLAGVRPAA